MSQARLLVLKLDVEACEVEASLNGLPVLRAGPDDPHALLAVNEYALAGPNQLGLCIWPPSLDPASKPVPPFATNGQAWARLRLLLPRVGHAAHEATARTLAELTWAPEAGTLLQPPLQLNETVDLPLGFPRWRWLDAPPIDPAQASPEAVGAHLTRLSEALAAGDPEPWMAATRWRLEELAVAYQWDARELLSAQRQHWQQAHAAGRLHWLPAQPADLLLRPVAGGRLIDCVDPSGQPYLRTQPDADGLSLSLPLRLACVDGKFYGLR